MICLLCGGELRLPPELGAGIKGQCPTCQAPVSIHPVRNVTQHIDHVVAMKELARQRDKKEGRVW